MNNRITLGSLFDGSGGFPLGGLICGVTPLWASEIEPFPVRVTTKRIPEMKHFGDVSKLSGATLSPVDIITFGSPCQDMSIAGKREGLCGTRSNLFYEAIRIIKEMRCKTNGKYPRFIVWENVPGAFSSNKGEDFRTVLEEICKIKDERLSVSKPKSGKWTNSGEIMGDGFPFVGESLMLNTGECPNEERESTLSQILQANVPTKYYLSQKACLGILRRASARGKQLPQMLRIALEQQALTDTMQN